MMNNGFNSDDFKVLVIDQIDQIISFLTKITVYLD